ncbi:dihydropteroate synthase [Flavobacterium sp.]|uniref:dihydropteroate synthase n=1 Tax=Flavobacterium sp. TaxID=239 RepID=UPI0039E536C1
MTINCNGALIDLQQPKIMGILNLTPDSFFDGGQYDSDSKILLRAEQMIAEGATFIDLGAYSTRPGADFVSEAEERQRIVPVVKQLKKHLPEALLSIDTFRSTVAQACVEEGAALVNDISAGKLDPKMMETVGRLQVPFLMMHLRGNPQTMQEMTDYDDIVKDMLLYFSERIQTARSFGINDLIVDPGFGFAKTLEQNYEVLQKLELLQMLDLPILAGVSRKSMIYKALGVSAAEALNGTSVVNTIALTKGAKILRVHDVKEAVEAVKLYNLCNL